MIQLWVPLLTFLLVCIVLNNYIRWILPEKNVRMKFKAEKEFYLVLAYFLVPLVMLQGELIYLNYASVTYEELNIFTFLVVIKVALFVTAGKNLETFLHSLKANKTLKNYIQSE